MHRVRSKTRSPSFVFSPSCRLAHRLSLTTVCIFALFASMWARAPNNPSSFRTLVKKTTDS